MPGKDSDKTCAYKKRAPMSLVDIPDTREAGPQTADPPACTVPAGGKRQYRSPIRITGPDLRDSRPQTANPRACTVPTGKIQSRIIFTGEDLREPKTPTADPPTCAVSSALMSEILEDMGVMKVQDEPEPKIRDFADDSSDTQKISESKTSSK